jgi:hypothetical protein
MMLDGQNYVTALLWLYSCNPVTLYFYMPGPSTRQPFPLVPYTVSDRSAIAESPIESAIRIGNRVARLCLV